MNQGQSIQQASTAMTYVVTGPDGERCTTTLERWNNDYSKQAGFALWSYSGATA